MPDPNKLAFLADLCYEVRACCGLCKNGRFAPGLDWGSCVAFTYEHEKHGQRKLSVHRAGVCGSDFQLNDKKKADMQRSGIDAFFESLMEGLPLPPEPPSCEELGGGGS